MTSLKINNQETPYVVVPVPVDAKKIYLNEYDGVDFVGYEVNNEFDIVEIPTGNYSIIGCIDSLTMDEGVKVMVEDFNNGTYRDYSQPIYNPSNGFFLHTVSDYRSSVHSLLSHNKIEIQENQKLLIIKKI